MSARAALASATNLGRALMPCKLVTACWTKPSATGRFAGALHAYTSTQASRARRSWLFSSTSGKVLPREEGGSCFACCLSCARTWVSTC
eukprot:1017684-Pelagomonas_calceolata.AAC.5